MSTPNEISGMEKYRWYILTLSSLTAAFVLAIPTMCMPVLFKEISEDLNLSIFQLGVVWGIVPLAGTFVVLFGGMLSDRFGAKRILVSGCILTGLAGMLRGVSDSFTVLTLTMFLYGLLMVATAPGMLKALSMWFSDKQFALANGILAMSMAIGFMVGSMISATVLSPLIGGWRNVLFFYGFLGIVVGILWFFSRSAPPRSDMSSGQKSSIPFKQAISHVLRVKRVWLLALGLMLQIACVQGTLGYLPVYLRDIGWSPVSADSAVSLFHGASMIGTVPVALIATRTGSREKVLFFTTLAMAIGVGMLAVSGGSLVWVSVLVAGVVRDGFMAVISTAIIQSEGIGSEYAGTAVGLTQTVSRFGEFLSPPIGNSLGTLNPRYPFIFWSALAAAALGFFYVLIKKKAEKLTVRL
ncbi:CynX/NimT family MFS transporter [Chloroflexota bacterium]